MYLFEEDSVTAIIESSIHTEYMKLELLKNNSPLVEGSDDRKLLEDKISKIKSTSNSLSGNIKLVEQEFKGCIIQVQYLINN